MSCEECMEVHEAEGDEPPCDECDKPELMQRNRFAWHMWQMLNEFERPREAGMSGAVALPIPATNMVDLVHAYGGDEREVEKVQIIERHMLPWIREQESS